MAPHPLILPKTDLQFSLAPSIGGGDTIQHTLSNTTTPVTGVARVIVIAVEFDDEKFNLTMSDLNVIFFHRLSNYIANISYGKLRIEGTIAGPFHAPKLMSAYGADNGMIDGDLGAEVRTYQLVEDAVKIANPRVDFSSYQYLIIVHAGVGQESNPRITRNIWSVAFVGGITFKTSERSYDRADIVPEREGQGADVLGVVAHEFLHLLGLPDLYNAGDESSGDAGKWDIMARGAWNGNPPGSAPAHPTAWSKVALGWIEPEQIAEIGSGKSLTAYVDPIERSSPNLKAVKVPLSDSLYYMAEYRSRIFDSGLPDEGVLITRINPTRTGPGGLIRIISTHGGTNKAPLKLGEFYTNDAEGVLISTRFFNATTYGIDVIRGQYRTIEIKLPSSNTRLLVDGKPCTSAGSGMTAIFVTPGPHTIAVPNVMMISSRLRAVFDAWSDGVAESQRIVQTASNVSLSTSYKQQVLLSVASNGISDTSCPGKLEVNGMSFLLDDLASVDAWIDINEIANVTVLTRVIKVDEGTRYVFKGWSGDNSNSSLLSLPMSQPLELVAQFQKQFYLKVKSDFGGPTGEGWYDDGTKTVLSVSSPHYISTTERYVFDSWSGSESKQPAVPVVMDRPRTMIAQWKRQLLISVALLGSDSRPLGGKQLGIRFEAPNGTEVAQLLAGDVWLDDGLWLVKNVTWMGIDVSPLERTYRPIDSGTWIIRPSLHTLVVSVTSRIFRRAISDVMVCIELPDKELYISHTNQTGQITIGNLAQHDYRVKLMREGEEVSTAHFYVAQDTRLEVTISDPLENAVVAGFAIAGIVSLTLVATPGVLSRLRRKRRVNSAALDERVYEYISSHAGVISKSRAARDLGISRETLMRVIRHLETTRRRDEHEQQPNYGSP
jgi:M6 family metalloprotease-like protein